MQMLLRQYNFITHWIEATLFPICYYQVLNHQLTGTNTLNRWYHHSSPHNAPTPQRNLASLCACVHVLPVGAELPHEGHGQAGWGFEHPGLGKGASFQWQRGWNQMMFEVPSNPLCGSMSEWGSTVQLSAFPQTSLQEVTFENEKALVATKIFSHLMQIQSYTFFPPAKIPATL